jgi:hypothetical protein
MIYLDAIILNGIERACRRFQRLTGRTNIWLAVQLTNLSIVVYFLWAAVAFATADSELRVIVAVFCVALVYALVQTLFRESIEAYENSAFRRVASGKKNPRRVRDALLRVSFLAMTLFFACLGVAVHITFDIEILLLTLPLLILTTGVLYLLACDPLPPRAVKVREERPGLAQVPVNAQKTP